MSSPQTLTLTLTLSLFLFLPVSSSNISLSFSPQTLTKSNPTIQIRWSNIPSPSPLDFLAIYNPPNSPDHLFIGYLFLNSSLSWPSGAGHLRLPLANLRSNYTFRLFRWTPDEVDFRRRDHDGNPIPGTRHRLAVSGELGFENWAAAEQVHLSFADREDEMRVMFVTGDGRESFASYGRERGRLDRIVGTEVSRYGVKDMCDSPANSSLGWRDPGFVHDGVMKNLERGKKYYYQVGSDAAGWSPTYSFISRNSQASKTIAFLFGDMGTYVPYSTFYRSQQESISTVRWILRDLESVGDNPAFISHIGDISYARGFSWIWDEFFNLVEPIASRVPYHVCIGNHEYDWPSQPWRPSWSNGVYGTDGGGECGVPYSRRFNMPGNSTLPTGTGSPNTRNLYYSFDAGPIHFLYISTETNFLRGSDQHEFIEADLRGVDRDKTPFIVVQGHRPMYTTSREERDEPLRERMLENLEPLFVDYNVTLALWGHVHRYERFCPLRNNTCQSESAGTVHVVIGMGGQDWQASWRPRPDHQDVPIFPQPAESMYRSGEFGYTRLVATREKLTLSYVGNHDGEVHDTLEIWSGRRASDGRGGGVTDFELWIVGGAVLLMIGTILGYCFVVLTHRRKEKNVVWIPVKNEVT